MICHSHFTYSHLNTTIDQLECVYCPNYFLINFILDEYEVVRFLITVVLRLWEVEHEVRFYETK